MKNIDIISFFRDNGEKVVTIKSYLYSFYYRFIVKHTSMKKLKKRLGKEGEESPYEETPENQRGFGEMLISECYFFIELLLLDAVPDLV